MARRDIHDHYFREAKRQGYRSRAAYKLLEIDDRKRLLHEGDAVLDCGAAPGAWLQVAAERVGPRGVVVGIDLQPITGGLPAQVRTVQDDFTTIEPEDLLALRMDAAGGGGGAARGVADSRFEVILSDMAPSTTGDRTIDHHGSVRLCHAVLDRCPDLLWPGGRVAMKVFEGPAYPDLLQRAKSVFEKVKGFSPKASRSESTEIYLLAEGYRAEGGDDEPGGEDGEGMMMAPPRRPQPRGWGG